MPTITLPDGTERQYSGMLSVLDVARDIGPGLAKATLAGVVDESLVDASYVLRTDVRLRIVTARDEEGLSILRHSCAHLMAQAIKLLYPEVRFAIGPVIEDGFYYDCAYSRPFTPEDLVAIERRMEDLVAEDLPVSRSQCSRAEGIALFQDLGEDYKVEIVRSLPEAEPLSLYSQGKFIDLCRGPHVPSTGHLRAFKLTRLSAAYWRGDASRASLQRIYGTAWPDKKSLKAYLDRVAEAKRRDHRKLGKALDLFHFQEEAPGMVFWHPHGQTLYSLIEQHVRTAQIDGGYQEVRTPMVVDRTLWERSGHWDKFRADMFTTCSEHREYAIKPMNCPGHVQIFNQGLKSYRDLPLRLAEFGSCHRNEQSGALHGLMRTRHFVQDDAHIFCTEGQLQSEVAAFIDMLYQVYADFGFQTIRVNLSTRPAQRVGGDAVWDKAERALQQALENQGLQWTLQEGEGAFYGPKIEFSLRDCLGRVWQCGTIQMDFSMPERLSASYVAEDGSRRVPVMLHRAILGSLERFIGILLEDCAGKLPPWLAPVQAAVLPITREQGDYAQTVVDSLRQSGFRVVTDLRNETIGLKIREHTLRAVPYLLVVGAREVVAKEVSVRTRKGVDKGTLPLSAFAKLLGEASARMTVQDPVED